MQRRNFNQKCKARLKCISHELQKANKKWETRQSLPKDEEQITSQQVLCRVWCAALTMAVQTICLISKHGVDKMSLKEQY